jgi:AcrR family transcriptional regulator
MKNDKQKSSKQRILSTAVQIFARKGYASTGMRELADSADVNLAMINYFFGSKKELLKVILETFFRGYLEIIEAELTGPGSFDEKISRFIHRAITYISDNRDYMIVTLAELPHDDPEITEYKAQWARKAMYVVQDEICTPVKESQGVDLSPAAIGPLLIGMMSSRFLFAPIMEQVNPPGYGEDFFRKYPDIIASIFLEGIKGLGKAESEVSNG